VGGLRLIMKQYRLTYETKGVRVVDVWVNEDLLPENFDLYDPDKQDEVLYSLQYKAQEVFQDNHHGKCVNVLPVLQLKAVKNES
jgi:hypothetical protein